MVEQIKTGELNEWAVSGGFRTYTRKEMNSEREIYTEKGYSTYRSKKKKSYNRCRKKAVVTRTKNLEREADTHGENERKLVTHKREIPNGEENVTYD